MVKVKKLPGQSDDQVIRNFSKKVMDAGIIQEAKRRKFYLKPSLAKKLRKKLKQEEAARVKLFSWKALKSLFMLKVDIKSIERK